MERVTSASLILGAVLLLMMAASSGVDCNDVMRNRRQRMEQERKVLVMDPTANFGEAKIITCSMMKLLSLPLVKL